MTNIRCNACGREFGQRDYDTNFRVRWSHDTQNNEAFEAELCCDCLEKLMDRYMEEMNMAATTENNSDCAFCGKSFEYSHDYQMRCGGSAPKMKRNLAKICRDCFETRAARFAEECAIKPKAVPWINEEACSWRHALQKKVNAYD